MKRIVCVVYDKVAETYGQPLFFPAVGVGLRSFRDEVNRAAEDNNLYRHPGDYALFQLGTFDDSTAEFEVGKPSLVAEGVTVKE